MKTYALFIILLTFVIPCVAQKEMYDITVYTPPPGWKRETGKDHIAFSHVNETKRTWCLIALYKSTESKGSLMADFDADWQELLAQSHTITGGPIKEKPQTINGYQSLTGAGKATFNNSDMLAWLTVLTVHTSSVCIIAKTNDANYLKGIESFRDSIRINQTVPATAATNTTPITPNAPVLTGTWGKNTGIHTQYADPVSYGTSGYTKDQYTFNKDGTYRFTSKTFGSAINNILLIKEKGKYTISGKTLTIVPQESLLESWSKSNGTDKWGKKQSTQKREPEKVAYTFTMHYFSGIKEWNLVLMADKETHREGKFSNNKSYNNAWYFQPIGPNNPLIELPPAQ